MWFPFNDLRRELAALQPELLECIAAVLDHGQFILGPNVAAFEQEFAQFVGARYAVGVSSGTDALRLTLEALEVGAGAEVLTVANTAVPTANAISAAGARPVFVDIDPVTYTMDASQVEARLTSSTRVLLPVHLYGQAADLGPLRDLADRYGLALVEDCAQAHGALYQGRAVGIWGRAGCYSFYPSKNLGACGDAGMIVTNDADLAERVRQLRDYGQSERDVFARPGHNNRLDEIQAAILRLKLRHLPEWNERRRILAARYTAAFEDLARVTPPRERPAATPVYHLYVVRSPGRDELRQALTAAGLPTLIHYPTPIHRQPAYAGLGWPAGSLPVTEQCAREILSLPLFPFLKDEEQEQVVTAVRRWAQT